MMILGGVRTPFVLDVTFRGDDDIDTVITQEFDTLFAAKAALEELILANPDHMHDYGIDFRRGDLMGGDLVKFHFVTVTPDRQRSIRSSAGVWSISWRKPEPPLADDARALRARLAEA